MRCVNPLIYNDPFNQRPEPGWYNNQIVYYLNLGPVFLEEGKNTIADIYQFIYGFDPAGNPIRVMGQWNIINVVPGDPGYSQLWRVIFIIVPSNFIPQSIRSVSMIRKSGYESVVTDTIIDCPVL
ncbi:hypothetical protein [Alkaliphilus serpentinus]|uniref:Uncharacterized protein n=1 Tax=Alkaliphilus serpentinus TaxID=1482731 RepID=A0A833HL37_9FIRM|nr:hypothetical protein [Alkaliphilus serpentinus]KAB3524855.1 hypothetical protein F8153_15655 [Alkaliphilus serpentinus]